MRSSAPLMSLQASGTFAGLITASRWKGRPYLRERVDPSNPQTTDQSLTRSVIGAVAKGSVAVLTSFKDTAGFGSLFFQSARDQAPSGQSWVSNMQGKVFPDIATIDSAWAALSGTQSGYFDTTAAAIGLVDYVPTYPHGATRTAGQILFTLASFASRNLSGTIKTDADTAIAAASQGDVDDFGDDITVSHP